MRHGYRGPSNVLWKVGESSWDSKKITDTLKALPTYGPLLPAVVTSANPQEAVPRAGGWYVSVITDGWHALGASLPLGYPATSWRT